MTFKTGFIKTPYTSLLLLIVWMALNGWSFGHFILGSFLAISIPWLTRVFIPQTPQANPKLAARYLGRLVVDIVRSSWDVTRKIFVPMDSLNPGFIAIPLDLKGDMPLTLLTSSISLTPGTVSVDLSDDRNWLYVHALDITDEEAIIREIKERYETPLMEMFPC